MSENEEPENDALVAPYASSESSQEAFQPMLRRRGRPHMGETQSVDLDYIEAAPPPTQRRSVDVLPWEGDEDADADAEEPAEQPNEAIEPPVAAIEVDEQPPAEQATTSSRAQQQQQQQEAQLLGSPDHAGGGEAEAPVINLDTPSPPKKRKRMSNSAKKALGTPVLKPASSNADDDEDDGMTCPICLDSWEMSGEHRLVSLKCGHLFGESCIRRWLNESMRQSAVKVCPQCKSKSSGRDLRYLYAKRLRAIDRTEEHRLREDLDAEKRRVQALTTELATVKMAQTMVSTKLLSLELDNTRLRQLVRNGGGRGAFGDLASGSESKVNFSQLASHKLYMEKNFEITREPGCRVLLYSMQHSTLVASQKSAQNLFPGYGVRFIDPPSFKPLHFLHTSAQLVRDMCFSADQHSLAVASREPRVKLFDIRTRLCSSVFTASDKILWSCGMDRSEREHFLYVGDLRGNTYVYDVRFPDNIISEFQADDNFSPVIHIAAVPAGKIFTSGGFLVCQLTLLTFYEYSNDTAVPTRLDIEGPFLSMQYDVAQEMLLISARSNPHNPQSRFILGKLDKIDGTPVLDVKATIFGSKGTPIMTRPTQLSVESNTLVVGYLQDSKQLMVHDVRREERVQTLPVNEVVYDICPVNTNAGSYLAALTDNKCRVYKVNSYGGK